MDTLPNENFFEISLSQEGSDRVMRLYRTVRILFFLSILLSIFFLAVGYMRLIFYSRIPHNRNFLIRLESIALPVYTIVLTALMMGQLYSFFYFSRLCKKSIQLRQADLFNYSFKWLTRSALFSISMVVVEIAMTLFSIYELSFLISRTPAS